MLTTLTLRASIDTMFGDLGDALRRLGVHTRAIADAPQAPNLPLVHGLVGELRDYDGPRFIIDNNAKSRLTAQGADGKPVFIHDVWNIPRLSIFESSPIHHLEQMAQMPNNAAMTVIDAAHVEVLDTFGVARRATQFMAHAGPPPLEPVLPMRERPIDVLFIGNVKDVPEPDSWVAALACADTLKPAIARVIARRWEATSEGSAAMLRHALAAEGAALEPRRDLALTGAIELYVNNLKRRELLSSIAAANITVCGDVDLRLPHSERVTVTGPTSFVKTLQLMDNAKIVLNTMPFHTGAHERIFYGLSRGAAILSDYSQLIAEPAAERLGIAIFPQEPAALDDAIAALLARPLDDAVAAGRRWYARRHTWDQRAQQILDLMTPLF
ncbi:MAG TPA: glycosyltransferase [Stellaceae bacterium]|nr:glycosyltransferase [Stellaceae bacterium]